MKKKTTWPDVVMELVPFIGVALIIFACHG